MVEIGKIAFPCRPKGYGEVGSNGEGGESTNRGWDVFAMGGVDRTQ